MKKLIALVTVIIGSVIVYKKNGKVKDTVDNMVKGVKNKLMPEKEEMVLLGYVPQGNGLSKKIHAMGDIVPVWCWKRVGGENEYAYGLRIHITPTMAFNIRQGVKETATYLRTQVMIRSLEDDTKLVIIHAPVEGVDEHAMAVVIKHEEVK